MFSGYRLFTHRDAEGERKGGGRATVADRDTDRQTDRQRNGKRQTHTFAIGNSLK